MATDDDGRNGRQPKGVPDELDRADRERRLKAGIHLGFFWGGVFAVATGWLTADALLAFLGGLACWLNWTGWRFWKGTKP